jgi:hypothetical protein
MNRLLSRFFCPPPICCISGKGWGYTFTESIEETNVMQISFIHPDGADITKRSYARRHEDYMICGMITPTMKRLDLLAKTSCIRDHLAIEQGFQKTDRTLEAIFKNLHVNDKEKLGFFRLYIQVMAKTG